MNTDNFLKWVYNYPNMKETLKDCFGEHMGDHFYQKFDGYYEKHGAIEAPVRLVLGMSDKYRKKLYAWIENNFINKK